MDASTDPSQSQSEHDVQSRSNGADELSSFPTNDPELESKSPLLPQISAESNFSLFDLDSIMSAGVPGMAEVNKRASNVHKLAEENEKLKSELKAMSERLERAERKRQELERKKQSLKDPQAEASRKQ
ncbi:hypothetical protein D9757_002036 [Collybiopsis confluens]|uniref:Uncharacterized protein n=1 Tax=Collybiopsis confluens TaxID=2823264 RepID=A0A8H5HXP6_9AGAR|nr:hypothetical protein D9757_002036 [Collybiopsis confluens]